MTKECKYKAALEALNAHKKRNSFIIFEWGYFMTFKLYGDGRIERETVGNRGHIKFRPTFKQKMQLVMRILTQ